MRPASCVLFALAAAATHIYTLEKDFSKLQSDGALATHVGEIVRKLKTFKVAVHPRIRLFYELLRRGIRRYDQQSADSLYSPRVYRAR